MLRLALCSLRNRWTTASLVVATIAVSVALLLTVQRVRHSARDSFESALAGADLLVGARTGEVNLLLLAVFRIGDATANVSWDSYRRIDSHPDVAWTVPISLGDTHRGFRVLGTSAAYFMHFRHGDGRTLRFEAGGPFRAAGEAVVGAEVAQSLGYHTGDAITLAHGTGGVSFLQHEAHPQRIVGVLARTGTPVDRTIHVDLDAITALHVAGAAPRTTPESITAFLIGMRSKALTLTMQRAINAYRAEPLTAIIPAVTLGTLWRLVGMADRVLLIVSGFVVGAGLLGMMTVILAGLNERRREMALLRAIGARPREIFGLLVAEAGLLAGTGVLLGAALGMGALAVARPMITARFGVDIALHAPASAELRMLAAIVIAGLATGLVPAARAYFTSLGDGLQPRT